MRALVFLALLTYSALATEPPVCSGTYCRTWKEFAKLVRYVLDECKLKSEAASEDFVTSMQSCLKNKTVTSLDRLLQSEVIPLAGGFELVPYSSLQSHNRTARVLKEPRKWKWQVIDRLDELLRTHVIRFRADEIVEGRRRHYRQLFPLMMFAFMKLLVILVPLGFQFMAVISGKALLLSKMALMLASAQAMKKVTSAWFDVYHAPYYPPIHRSYEIDQHHHHQQQQGWQQPAQQYAYPAVPTVYDYPAAHEKQPFDHNRWQQ